MKAFINPGHCPGVDPGAVGPTGLREADVDRSVGALVEKYLEAAGVECLTVQNDSLEYIAAASNAYAPDVFVSIHCNAATPSAQGTEIYTSRGQTEADSLATCIMNRISEKFPDLYVRADWSDGDVDKEAGFYVLNRTEAPAVLIELAFISNPFEEELLRNDLNQDMYARAIAVGVTDFLSHV